MREEKVMEELLKIDNYFNFYGESYIIEKDKYGYYNLKSTRYNCNSNTLEWLIKSAVRELNL